MSSMEECLRQLQAELTEVEEDRTRRSKPALSELRSLALWRGVLAECLGTFLYVFVACGSCQWQPSTLGRALAQGAGMTAAARWPAVHLNPALTVGALVARRLSPLRASLCAAAQCGGALAGAALLMRGLAVDGGVNGQEPCAACTEVASGMGPWRAFGLEATLSFLLSLVAASRGGAVALGAAQLAGALLALPVTGASMNPARSLGPAFVANRWTHHWVYWCGPLLGSILAALVQEHIFDGGIRMNSQEQEDNKADVPGSVDEQDSKPMMMLPPTRHAYPESRGGPFNAVSHRTVWPPASAHHYGSLPRAAHHRTWVNYGTPSF